MGHNSTPNGLSMLGKGSDFMISTGLDDILRLGDGNRMSAARSCCDSDYDGVGLPGGTKKKVHVDKLHCAQQAKSAPERKLLKRNIEN